MDESKKEGEIGLLDQLIVVAENIRLLVLVPLAVGLLALGVAFAVPKSYVSQAVLSMPMPMQPTTAMPPPMTTATPAQTALMMVSPQVLDAVIAALNLSEGGAVEVAREKLVGQVKVAAGKDGMVRLDVTAPSPVQAQAIANAVVDSWLKSAVPGEQERAMLEKRLAHATSALDSVNRIMTRLADSDAPAQKKFAGVGELGSSLITVADLQARYLGEVFVITRQLKGLSREDILKQAPTLPADAVGPRKSVIVVLSMLTSGFVLLLWVFMRQAWRNVAQDPLGAQKQARLRAALGFK